jgi:membrane-associated phospholipid phosphatase
MISNRTRHAATIEQVCLRSVVPAIVTWALIPLTFLLPFDDSLRTSYFDLTDTFSQLAYWLSQSGGKFGIPIVAISMITLLVTRRGITFQQRWKEISIVVLIAAICGGGGAALNEYILKEQLKIPRPNIIWLAGENGSGPLGMTPEDFYESGNKEARRKPLAKALSKLPRPAPLSSSIEAYWIDETGYSFPSAHAFSVMFFATFFLTIAVTYLTTKRLWIFYVLLPWALVVCYSRPILRVHTPADITVGGLLGLVVGLVAWVVARILIRRFAYQATQTHRVHNMQADKPGNQPRNFPARYWRC